MPHPSPVTAEAALLRVLFPGESDGPDIIRKVRDWTGGTINLDERTLAQVVQGLENQGLVERREGAIDKRTGQPRATFALTTKGQTSAMGVLADSLTRKE